MSESQSAIPGIQETVARMMTRKRGSRRPAQIYADDGAMDDSSNVDEYFQTAVEFFIAADELEGNRPPDKLHDSVEDMKIPRSADDYHEPKKRARGRTERLESGSSRAPRRQKRMPLRENEKCLLTLEGHRFQFGDHVGRKKAFNERGEQISKSCHQCQEQHISWSCQASFDCSASYCTRCVANWYPEWTIDKFRRSCARCRGICNCRACLRKECSPIYPSYSEEQLQEYAKHILRVSARHVRSFLEVEEAEAAYDGKALTEVHQDDSACMRVSCDECAASVPNLYRLCRACGLDLCTSCCQHSRRLFKTRLTLCPQCRKPMDTRMLMSNKVLEILKNVAEEYGDSSCPSSWTWLGDSQHLNEDERPQVEKSTSGATPSGNWLMVSQRPDGKQNYLFCPNAEDFDPLSPNRAAAVQQFQDCMRAGEPVVIRGLKAKINWGPETMLRACVDRGNKQLKAEPKPQDVMVIDCMEDWAQAPIHQRLFFNLYQHPKPKCMLKVVDWPPSESFAERLKRHNQDFMEMLPLPEYMHPTLGPLNTHRSLPSRWLPPDLGPKTYIALGRIPEHEGDGDSVTKLHMAMSDTINVLCHAQYKPGEKEKIKVRQGDEPWDKPTYGNAGAVWDVVRRVDVPQVRKFLSDRLHRFNHNGIPVSEQKMVDPYHDQMFMMTERDRKELQEEYGIHVWHFEQHVWDAVYIPCGCPHQVRNLRSCFKTALDFVPPESFRMIKNLQGVYHVIGRHEKTTCPNPLQRTGADILQGTAMLLHAAKEAYCKVTKHAQFHAGSYMSSVGAISSNPQIPK